MARKTTIAKDLPKIVAEVGDPVTSAEVDVYGKLQGIRDRSHRLRTVLKAWKDQQEQDRRMRKQFAFWLIGAMALQMIVVNVSFFLLGFGVLKVEEWTAKTFILAVFAEIAALVVLVVKYLFTPTNDKLLQLIEHHEKP